MTRARGWARAAATVVAVLALDQVTKTVVNHNVDRGDSVNVFFGLDVTNTRNRGVAFGFLEGKGGVVGALIAVALVALVVWFAVNAAREWLWLPVGLLLGGAIGNLIDRAHEGAVIDFIDPVWWPAFNVADACIVIGVLAMLYVMEGPARSEA
ncbi:MAG TPA: signal peptidase II [Thermoleophilaceae bacterium]|nr:signal peptidase II [Thermoleophilaceae bacterium]